MRLKHIHWLIEYVDSRGSINTNILTNNLSYIVTPSDYYVGAPSNQIWRHSIPTAPTDV